MLPAVNVPGGVAFRWLDWISHLLIRSVDVDHRIDRHYSDRHYWLQICVERFHPQRREADGDHTQAAAVRLEKNLVV